jgi:uncharacterized protein (TIGR02452 family)
MASYTIVKEDYTPSPDTNLPPLSWSERLVNVYKDTHKRAITFPVSPSIKIWHQPNKVLDSLYSCTNIEVTPEDTLVAGKRLKDSGFNPMILNFADDLDAGGVVDNGNIAQEESLWRRTNLCATQLMDFYPLLQNPIQEGIYSPVVTVFKDTEENKCVDLETPWQAAFIAVPGLKHPRVNSQQLVSKEDVVRMRAKVELILQTGKLYNHDALVLGPLGCGVWHSPPHQMATIFRNVIGEHKGVFTHITFACYDKGHAGNGSNYTIFKNILTAH